jgi:MFS family permease
MAKSTITKTWVAGLVVLVIGLIVGGIGLGMLLANGGTWVPSTRGNGYEFDPTIDGYFWTTISVMVAGFAVAAIGGIIQLAAWVGALVNTNRIDDRTWFVVLLAGGILGLAFPLIGFGVMVAYVVAGPDGTAIERQYMPPTAQPPMTQPPSTYAPTA